MVKTFKCGICGKEYDNLDDLVKCVTQCAENEKRRSEEEKSKRLIEINAAINGIKQAKEYYEQKLKEFREKYPEEYKMNFGNEKCGSNCDCSKTNPKEFSKDISRDKVASEFSDTVNDLLGFLRL